MRVVIPGEIAGFEHYACHDVFARPKMAPLRLRSNFCPTVLRGQRVVKFPCIYIRVSRAFVVAAARVRMLPIVWLGLWKPCGQSKGTQRLSTESFAAISTPGYRSCPSTMAASFTSTDSRGRVSMRVERPARRLSH